MDIDIACWCGSEMEIEGLLQESEMDLSITCPDCGRGYVATLTQYREEDSN